MRVVRHTEQVAHVDVVQEVPEVVELANIQCRTSSASRSCMTSVSVSSSSVGGKSCPPLK